MAAADCKVALVHRVTDPIGGHDKQDGRCGAIGKPHRAGRSVASVALSVEDVVPLHLADVTLPDWHPLHGGTGAVLAFALRHPTGLLLFETGIGTDNQFIDDVYQVEQRAIDAAL